MDDTTYPFLAQHFATYSCCVGGALHTATDAQLWQALDTNRVVPEHRTPEAFRNESLDVLVKLKVRW